MGMPTGRQDKATTSYQPFALLKKSGIDGFILALIAMIVLAYWWPEGGTGTGPLSLSKLANYGVSVIFFFYGLKLNRAKLRADLSNWKLHALIQGSTFILFPLLLLPVKNFLHDDYLQLLWLGCFFLASLPSTVSSSVVMVSIAKGNIPAAIFNASISSLLGVFITPLWMGLAGTTAVESLELTGIYQKLILQVLVPVALGMLLNKHLGHFAERNSKTLRYVDQSIILLIVYTAFCESFEQHMFSDLGTVDLVVLSVVLLGLFFLVYEIIAGVSRLLQFNTPDRITATFCGSKKSLVHGTVMASVLFANSTITGLLLLPLMLYHAMQLIMVSFIARKLSARK